MIRLFSTSSQRQVVHQMIFAKSRSWSRSFRDQKPVNGSCAETYPFNTPEEFEKWLKNLSKKVNKAKANGVPG
jgi:hypothetical protein